MVDWSKISTWTFEIAVAPTDMVDVALIVTLGSNEPFE
jgi:hypothetical protein